MRGYRVRREKRIKPTDARRFFDFVCFVSRSATLNDGENKIGAKFSTTCKDSMNTVKDRSVLKLTDVQYETKSGEREPFAVINGFEVVNAEVSEVFEAKTPAAKGGKTEPKTPASADRNAIPLAALNPYRTPWTVKVKLTNKGQVREYRSARGPGKVCSVDFVDEEGTAIGATLWKEAIDKYDSVLEVGKVFYVSKGSLKPANKQYSTSNNDYEMYLDGKAEIELCSDVDQSSAQKMQRAYAFVGIDRLASKIGTRANVDVVAIVKEVGEVSTIRRKSDNTELSKRELTLVDESAKTVRLTLWNTLATEQGEELASMTNPIVAIRSVRVSDYEGVSIGTVSRSDIQIEPENVERVQELKKWWSEGGSAAETKSAGEGLAASQSAKKGDIQASTLAELQPEEIAPATDKPTFAWVTAHTVMCKSDQTMYYASAPEEGNNKKVVETDGKWYCEANGETYDTCQRRYIMRFKAMDGSGSAWMNAFNDETESMFGMSADKLHDLKETDYKEYENVVASMTCKHWSFFVKVATEEYNGESKRRMTAVKCRPVNYVAESKKLLAKMGVVA